MYPFVGEKGMSLRSMVALIWSGDSFWWSCSVRIVSSSHTA
jgi:hypothetical protein